MIEMILVLICYEWPSFWGKHEMPSVARDQQPGCCICSCRLSELVDNWIWPFGSMLLSNSINDPLSLAWLMEKGSVLQGKSWPLQEAYGGIFVWSQHPRVGWGGSRVFLFEGPSNTDISEISSYLSVRFGVHNVFESLCWFSNCYVYRGDGAGWEMTDWTSNRLKTSF